MTATSAIRTAVACTGVTKCFGSGDTRVQVLRGVDLEVAPGEITLRETREMLAAVGLGGKVDARPAQLSGGQQQRVAIARALVHRPRLLVCDEPTAALDADSGRTVMELLRRVSVDSDRAVIVVTHDSRVYGYGDRVIEMGNGRVQPLCVRADFDESEIPRFDKIARAHAHPRGDSGRSYRLRFVRIEPYVVPKQSLTGDNRERVDTRVLQVVYAVDEDSPALFVGQQVDVFVDLDVPGATGVEAVGTR